MKTTTNKSRPDAALALLPKDPHVGEATSPAAGSRPSRPGIDTTIGPSEVPAGATLPPSEPVIPGKGRAPR